MIPPYGILIRINDPNYMVYMQNLIRKVENKKFILVDQVSLRAQLWCRIPHIKYLAAFQTAPLID